jgi:NAD(P)-dependent dehydrogenase (short-subunit alcohol dehydrogenase family)
MTPVNRLEGKSVIVTGAAQGIGLAIATRFANEGARVLLADINRPALHEAGHALRQPYIDVDVSKRHDIERMVAAAVQEFGHIDILVNNAGIFRSTPLLSVTEEEFDHVMGVNLKSALFAIQAVAPQMIQRRSGSIINVASVAAVLAAPGATAYCVSKAGLVQLTNVAAIELAPHGVRVNALGPGTFATDMAQGAYDETTLKDRILPRTPLGRLGRPEEAAGIALFLATDDSSYLTGKTLFADGGRMGLNLTL